MIENISKEKIPKDYVYVFKTKQLDSILNDNCVNIHIDLNYCFSKQNNEIFFEAFYWPPNNNITYKRLYIRLWALKRELLPLFKNIMDKHGFSDFIFWIKAILDSPDGSPSQLQEQRFCASLEDNEIKINII